MMNELHTRIAPTPSGYLHLGNAFSFLYTYLIYSTHPHPKSSLLLRIDDADAARSRDEYLDDIFFSLDWLGIDYSKGPTSVRDFKDNFSQQLRYEQYHTFLVQLAQKNDLVYACNCSRSQIKKWSTNGLYPNTCRNKQLALTQKHYAWRLKVKETAIPYTEYLKGEMTRPLATTMGDFVIKRKDGLPAYQIASLVDDLEDQINFIVRGNDLLDSTAAQCYLAQAAGKTVFSSNTFLHHPLILEDSSLKMSKSHHAYSLKDLRQEWKTALPVYQLFAKIIGITSPIRSLSDLTDAFDAAIHRIQEDSYLKDLLMA